MSASEQRAHDGPDVAAVRRPLGQLAIEAGLITSEQLASAIADIQSSGERLRDVLIRRGLADELQLGLLLELQEGYDSVPWLGPERSEEAEQRPEPPPPVPVSVPSRSPQLRIVEGGRLR